MAYIYIYIYVMEHFGLWGLCHTPNFFNNEIHMGEFIPPFAISVSFNTISHNNILPFNDPRDFKHFGKMKNHGEIRSIGINPVE
jgi:hypothetical protein